MRIKTDLTYNYECVYNSRLSPNGFVYHSPHVDYWALESSPTYSDAGKEMVNVL